MKLLRWNFTVSRIHCKPKWSRIFGLGPTSLATPVEVSKILLGNFFHKTFSFFSERAWKSSKILKIGFFEISAFFETMRFWGFSSPFREKTKSPMKKFPGQEMLKIIQQIHFLYLEIGKTTSRLIFWWKSKNQNFAFLKFFRKYFSRTPVLALEFYFFVLISKVDVVSCFYQLFLRIKNI